MGGTPPETFIFELFLDEQGQKISKSKGNGLSVDEWLTYGPEESLALFMFGKPHAAKKLYFDVIPKAVDEYIAFAEQYQRAANDPKTPARKSGLVHPRRQSAGGDLSGQLRAAPESRQRFGRAGPRRALGLHPRLRAGRRSRDASGPRSPRDLCAQYYEDFVHPQKRYREPTEKERAALAALADALENMAGERDAETVQNAVYEIGKTHGFEPLRDWFKAIYEVALGQAQGPRFGSFAALFGCAETAVLIRRALSGAFLDPSTAPCVTRFMRSRDCSS